MKHLRGTKRHDVSSENWWNQRLDHNQKVDNCAFWNAHAWVNLQMCCGMHYRFVFLPMRKLISAKESAKEVICSLGPHVACRWPRQRNWKVLLISANRVRSTSCKSMKVNFVTFGSYAIFVTFTFILRRIAYLNSFDANGEHFLLILFDYEV